MRTLAVVILFFLISSHAHADLIDSVGYGFSPVTLYSRSSLRDSSFPTSIYMLGGLNRFRLEYLSYSNDLPSNVKTRQFDNSAVLGYYNMEFLLRSRRGSILGRTRLYTAVGGGLFRSRLNASANIRENNIGYGGAAGFRYFANRQFFVGGEAKYLYAQMSYDESEYEDQDIGGLFFSLSVGYHFSDSKK